MVILLGIAVPVLAGMETQNFDTSPSDWEARSVSSGSYSDITGWSNTSYAGSAGEGHAQFHRLHSTGDGLNENAAWYADRDLGGTLDYVSSRVLSATGSFYVKDFSAYPDLGAGMWLGWFHPGWGTRMGIMLNDNGGAGLGWYAGIYNNWGALIKQQFMGSVSAGIKYDFMLEYDNLEGINGVGRFVARITPEGYSAETAVLHLDNSLTNVDLNAFGLARPNPSLYEAGNGTNINIYVDDLAYTSNLTTPVPEPGTLAALASGLIGIAGFGIRRRK